MTHSCVTQAGRQAGSRAPDSNSSSVFSQCSDGNSTQENSSLKRVAVVEDFFDIIYAMHVEMGADPGRAPKHAGQKKTYKAVRERTCALRTSTAPSRADDACQNKTALREECFLLALIYLIVSLFLLETCFDKK